MGDFLNDLSNLMDKIMNLFSRVVNAFNSIVKCIKEFYRPWFFDDGMRTVPEDVPNKPERKTLKPPCSTMNRSRYIRRNIKRMNRGGWYHA